NLIASLGSVSKNVYPTFNTGRACGRCKDRAVRKRRVQRMKMEGSLAGLSKTPWGRGRTTTLSHRNTYLHLTASPPRRGLGGLIYHPDSPQVGTCNQ
ncbi:unnamed protein product, partial [Nesidiocoris tenuis]